MSYAAIVWGQCPSHNYRVCKLQRHCIRTITLSPFNADTQNLFMNNDIPYFPEFIFAYNIKLVYNTLKKLTPISIQIILNYKETSHYYTTNRELKVLEIDLKLKL